MLAIPLLTLAEQTSDIMQGAQQALKAKKFDQAIKQFSRAIERGDAPVTAFYFRGNAYEQ